MYMVDSTEPPEPTPNRTDPIPESYGIYVSEERIHVWQYRHNVSEPDGEWQFVETFRQADQPRLSVEQATLTAPTADGYWIYSTAYDCVRGCNRA